MNCPSGKKPGEKPVIGIVGGVGAGKSTAAAELAGLGCAVVDGDAIGHELLADPQVKREIKKHFKEGVFDAGGEVDRPALAEVVFGDPAEMKALNAILHPRIRSVIIERIAAGQKNPSVKAVVLDAAVLFEAGWDELCTHLVFIKAVDRLRTERAAAVKGWDRSKWQAAEKSQISLDKKAEKCDYTIENNSSVSYLRKEIHRIFRLIVHAED